ncbi:UNVERIFIED_CONTAM: hypothetical protein FKN15_048695 [Acipenser sinensis]
MPKRDMDPCDREQMNPSQQSPSRDVKQEQCAPYWMAQQFIPGALVFVVLARVLRRSDFYDPFPTQTRYYRTRPESATRCNTVFLPATRPDPL